MTEGGRKGEGENEKKVEVIRKSREKKKEVRGETRIVRKRGGSAVGSVFNQVGEGVERQGREERGGERFGSCMGVCETISQSVLRQGSGKPRVCK